MTKEVYVKISGLQAAGGDGGMVETSASGEYYKKNGKHYIIFEETMDGFSGTVKNLIKAGEDRLEITKRGIVTVQMIFEKGRKYKGRYQTPYGSFPIEIDTRGLTVGETENQIGVMADYMLEADYGYLADCKLRIEIRAKGE